jgi:hypothetical protein
LESLTFKMGIDLNADPKETDHFCAIMVEICSF